MPVAIDFKVLGETQLSRSLDRWATTVIDATPAFAELLDHMKEQVSEQFESEGGRGSGGWAELKPETIEFKARMGYPLEILHRTLALKYSLTAKGNPDGGVAAVTPNSLTYGTDIPYAIYHQKGAPRANLPVRKVIDFTEEDRQTMMKTLQAYVIEQARASGLK